MGKDGRQERHARTIQLNFCNKKKVRNYACTVCAFCESTGILVGCLNVHCAY